MPADEAAGLVQVPAEPPKLQEACAQDEYAPLAPDESAAPEGTAAQAPDERCSAGSDDEEVAPQPGGRGERKRRGAALAAAAVGAALVILVVARAPVGAPAPVRSLPARLLMSSELQ